MIKIRGIRMYDGPAWKVATEAYYSIISKSDILRGIFLDTKHDSYVVHKVDTAEFNRADKLSRYYLAGVYNRDTKPEDIQEDIEAI